MRKLFLSMALVASVVFCFAQNDIITKRNGDDINSKVLEVTQTEVKYKKSDNVDGPTFTLPKSDILIIRYSNGTKDLFSNEPVQQVASTASVAYSSTSNKSFEGQQDSRTNYRAKNSGAGWTLDYRFKPAHWSIAGSYLLNLNRPDENQKFDPNKMTDPQYNTVYRDQSKKTKSKKVWRHFAIGSGVWLVLAIIAAA